MDTCHILIVEDEALAIESWGRDIQEFNRRADKAFAFADSYARSKQEALEKLARQRFDCAVVDLRLPNSSDEHNTGIPVGNDVLHGVLRDLGIPAWVYSGYETEVSEEVKASNIKVARKEGGASIAILEDLEKQAGLMAAMEQMRCKVAQETSLLFNRSIWPRWEERWAKREDREMIKEIITRQTVAHVADALSQAPAHHPDEFYVVPALYSDRLETGDLLTHDNETLIVLTPRCNLANSKLPTKIVFALCAPCEAWTKWQGDLVGSGKTKGKAEDDIGKHATQGHAIATHFIPPLDTRGPWLVDFRELRVVDSSKVAELLQQRIATVAPQFIANLVQRHAAYIGRIGQPDIDAALLVELCRTVTPAAAKGDPV